MLGAELPHRSESYHIPSVLSSGWPTCRACLPFWGSSSYHLYMHRACHTLSRPTIMQGCASMCHPAHCTLLQVYPGPDIHLPQSRTSQNFTLLFWAGPEHYMISTSERLYRSVQCFVRECATMCVIVYTPVHTPAQMVPYLHTFARHPNHISWSKNILVRK